MNTAVKGEDCRALDSGRIMGALDGSLNARVEFYPMLDSTNAELSRMVQAIPPEEIAKHGGHIVVVAAGQTAGRGMAGRTFESPSGAGLYLSLLHCTALGRGQDMPRTQIVTALAAVGVCRAIEAVYGIHASIKWVNDIFLDKGDGRKAHAGETQGMGGNDGRKDKAGAEGGGNVWRKVCGILTEATSDPASGKIRAAIVGIGVNVLPGALSAGLSRVAGSILDSADDEPKLNALASSIINNVYALLEGDSEAAEAAIEEYKNRSMLINKTVTVHPITGGDGTGAASSYDAVAAGITDDARLVVRMADGRERMLNSGEVTLGSFSVSCMGAHRV